MKNESDVKLEIVRAIRKEGGYARRAEDKYTVGMPDLILIPVRCPVIFAEAKIIRTKIWGATQRQWVELTELHRPPHSFGMLLGWKEGTLYACAPATSVTIAECQVQMDDEPIPDFIRRTFMHV